MANAAAVSADSGGKWLFRSGGIAAVVLGAAYLAIIALYVPAGAPPNGVEARLAYLAKNNGVWWAILALSVLTDFLFVPMALSLYAALRGFHKSLMLLATACVALFIFLDLALTWTNYAVMIAFSARYAAAVTDVQRAGIVAMANYPAAVLESGLLFVYNTLVLAAGILLTGFVMLRGVFGKSTAYLGVVTGVLGIGSVIGSFFLPSVSVAIILTSTLTTIWVFVAGVRLYRLGRE